MKETEKTDLFSFLFTNLATGEFREVMLELRTFFCRLENEVAYQMYLNGEPAAESMPTPDLAIEAGVWISAPSSWGWSDIKRELPFKAFL